MDKQMIKEMEKENMSFIVIDNITGKEADIGEIALKEDWAKGLIYCDMQGFALLEDGTLVLLDECGKYEYCPSGRFTVVHEGAVVLTMEDYEKLLDVRTDVILKDIDKVFKEEFEDTKRSMERKIKPICKAIETRTRKETAEKFARLVEFHSVATMKDGREYFTISALGLKEILHEEFGIPYDEICKEFTEGKV